jgi:hypothetical protein
VPSQAARKGVVAIGWDLEGVDEHHPARVLGQRPVLAEDFVQAGMGSKRQLSPREVGLGGGRLKGRRRGPLGHVDEPELGVGAEAAVECGRPVAGLGGEEVAGPLPACSEPLVGPGGHLEQVD